jgi:phospholipase/lecithinase/hemolysin
VPERSRRCANLEDIMTACRRTFGGALIAMAIATAVVRTAPRSDFSRIVAFGASLSDAGNAFVLKGGTNTPHDFEGDPLLVPSAPYTRGGHHFSNGATWIEQFARSAGLAGSAQPALRAEGAGTNYAVGAARACDDGKNVNLSTQVDTFLQDVNAADPAALYTIEIGGNDIRDALVAYPSGSNGILICAINSIAQQIIRLHSAGARTFVVWRAPDVGLTPAIRMLDKATPGARTLANALSVAFNNGLDAVVAQLSTLPGIRIVRLDAFRLLNEMVADPSAFGLTEVSTACVRPNSPPYICDSPDEFLFWDGIHPTKAVHAIIAQEAASALIH